MHKVLIADDEEWIVENMKISIPWNQYGFEIVDTALDGVEALEKIEKTKPDVVFTDIRMPGLNGLELIKRVHQTSPGIQFIVISGFAEFAYAQKALNYGAVGYCLKPLEDNEIIMLLEKAKLNLILQNSVQKMDEKLCRMEENNAGSEEVTSVDGTETDTAKAMVKYVSENFTGNLTLQDLSDKFHIHSCYVSQLFKKETGQTFLEYLTGLRIAHACRLLRESDLSVNRIAEKSGYSDFLYFRKIFKKLIGKTPTEYRDEI